MSIKNLLARIVPPFEMPGGIEQKRDETVDYSAEVHDFAHCFSSDPLTQFACVFAALIHDADHSGTCND
jgi:hypothetical protein